MPRHVEGRRVNRSRDLEPGDYRVHYAETGQISSLYFAFPGFRGYEGTPITHSIDGPGAEERPGRQLRWEITEGLDGKVTVSPSILTWWNEGAVEKRFHCFLRAGTWEILDDTVGAEWD